MMIHRHKRLLRFVAVFLAMNMMYSIVFPTAALALTGGPSQPEVQSFEPVGTTDMVDVFSGDFNYNIPLIDVEGYPINIAYHSGITMDQEATWVGLGWNINPGVINRNMRGLPDDFNGDLVTKNFYIKPNWTLGTNFGLGIEFCGFGKASYGLGVYYNNYKGLGFENVVNLGVSTTGPAKFGANVALSSNTQSGFTISPNLSFSVNGSKKDKAAIEHKGGVGVSIGASYNSRSGMKTMNYGISVSSSSKSADKTTTASDGSTSTQKGAAGGASAGNNFSSISPGAQTYVPQLSMPMTSFNGTVRVTVGSEAYTLHPNGWVSGYFSNQSLATTGMTKAAYGYIYSHNKTSQDVLLDFNREKDGSYTTQNPVLPITNFTYDIYSVSGQGVGGMFRPYRNDIGVVHDDVMYSTSGSMSLGVEVGVGAGAHFGVDENVVSFNSSSSVWANNLYNLINFKASTGEVAYEPWYFKTVGEKTPVDETFLPNQNISAAFSAALYSSGGLYHTEVGFLNSTAAETGYRKNIVKSALVKSSRVSRNQMITSYTASQYRECDTRYIESYTYNDFRNGPLKINRKKAQNDPGVSNMDTYRLDDHVSELVVTQNNGSRYVYGIAAYNTKQTESSFTNGFTSDKETGQVYFDPNYLTSKKGATNDAYDGYFSSTSLPAYAHSYLLTAVLSADYVDVGQNGPTPDDLGTYTKINYTRLHNNYKWRVPYKHDRANASDGTNSDQYDDKANVIEGEKEIWFVNSIETKNYKAIFVLGNRRDGVSAKHTSGNSTVELKCLKSIQLYTKAELRVTGREPVPVKTVNFEYDYSLCPNVENNLGGAIDQDGNTSGPNINTAKGKLTLKKIYFTYGTSQKSRFSSYTFTYNSGSKNPSYNLKGYDRWGSYKPHLNIGEATPLYNSDHPYVQQEDVSNDYAEAWCLKEIRMPSGGKIKVDYEADDYAYVQNRRAQQMFRIAGFSNTLSGSIKNELYSGDNDAVNNYVFIQLTGTKYASIDAAYFQNEFVRGIENLYFNMLIKLAYGETYESVRGYTSIEESGVIDKGGIRYGWVRVQKANIDTGDDDKVSPFSKAAWQFARINMPHLVYPGSDFKRTGDVGGAIVSGVKSLVGVFFDLVDMARGFNDILRSKGFARHVKSNRSWIRLNSPDKMKKGGGVRVKSIRMTDNWNSITNGSESDFEYGQEYDYTTKEKFGSGYRTISSGVASYEPMVGNDENPFRQPVSYDKQNYLIPDDSYYTEEPFGEIFFPSASVGYSRITVRNLKHTNVNKHATGKTVHEFYTAYDFPTITRRTNVDSRPVTPGVLKGLFSFSRSSSMTTSQGFMIELNDMHGKPKAQWTYAEPAVGETNDELKLLSGVQYIYKTDANDASHLNNVVPALKKDGSLVNQLVGVESDLVGDMRQSLSETGSGGVQINTEFFLAFIFPVAIPTFLPSYATERTAYRSVVMTKVVNRFGILEKTVAYQDGASISTKNLAWDAETGDVLLTSVENEYKDNIYNVTYPAYWAHDLMGPAYKNEGITLNGLSVNGSGVISLAGGLVPATYFVPGDEVFIISNQNASVNGRYWVDNTGTPGQFMLRAYNGNLPLTGHTYKAHIARSGRRNMMSLPMASVSSLQTPLVGSVLTLDNNTKVINTNATIYSDKWNKQCGYNVVTTTVCDTLTSYNDMLNTLLFLVNSQQLSNADQSGTFKGFDSTASGNSLFRNSRLNRLMDSCGTGDQFYVTNDSTWIPTGEITRYDTAVNNYKVFVCKDTLISVDDLFTDSVVSVYINDQGLITIVLLHPPPPVTPTASVSSNLSEYVLFFNLRELIPCVPANYDQLIVKGSDYKFHFYNPETRKFSVQCCDSVDRSDTILTPWVEQTGYYNHNLGFTISTCAGCANATINYNDSGCTLGKTLQSMSVVSLDGPYATVNLDFGEGCIIQATIYFYCPPVVRCRLESAVCTLFTNTSNNRFLDGTKGIWRKKKDYLFLEKRRRNNVTQGDIRRDGYYESFSPFWSRIVGIGYEQNPFLSTKWQWTSEITNYDARNGQEIETVDALGRYSAVLFSQTSNISLATAVGNNANRRQIGFNGFEEMEMINLPSYGSETACPSEHWNFYKENSSVTYDATVSHTGINSAKVPSGLSIWNQYDVRQYTPSDSQYCADCILPFYPDTGKYYINGWVKTSAAYTDATDRNATLLVNITGSSPQSYSFKPSGKIIEGWQRIEGVIMIPAGSTTIKVTWKGSTVSGEFAWFDDLRILPFNGSMKSFVYDPQTNRLMAQLDENNYATFYEYDEQGALKRVKKETENGIATISESRNSNIKRR